MTTMKFDKVPTKPEKLTTEAISPESIQQAWQGYENRPEYKQFNKHDLIETLLPHASTTQVVHQVKLDAI